MNNSDLIKISLSLAVIVLLIFLLAFLAKRFGLSSPQQSIPMRVIQRLRLGPRTQLMVIEVNEKRLVVGATPHHVSLLDSQPIPEEEKLTSVAATTHTQPSPFGDLLKKAQSQLTATEKGQSTPVRRSGLRTALYIGAALFLIALLLFFATPIYAQAIPIPAITEGVNDQGQAVWSLSIETLVLLTLLTFIPAALIMMTGFTRIIIVLGLLRNAMGTGAAPPNSILIGIALFLTFFAMAPVFDEIYEHAYEPLAQEQISFAESLQRGAEPLKEFMLHQTRENDLIFYADLAQVGPFEGPEQVPLRILVPAFITSELKTAFQIGFTVFIPFLIIDLVVASVLMSLGMMMVPPVTISLPFKLMLFVLADGWHLLLGSLARSFYL